MKKITAMILALVLAATFSVTAFAEEKIALFGGKMEVAVPEGFYSVWKDMTDSAELFEYYDLTLEEALGFLENNEAYFFTEDFIHEIYIFAYESEYMDFDRMDEPNFDEYLESCVEYYSTDYECEAEKFEKNGARYAKSVCYDPDEDISFAEYETIYGGMNVFIRLYCWEGRISPEMEEIADAFVESVVYNMESDVQRDERRNEIIGFIAVLIFVGVVKLIINKIKGIFKKKKDQAEPAPEQPLEEAEEPHTFCPECGAQVEEADKICPLCGARIK